MGLAAVASNAKFAPALPAVGSVQVTLGVRLGLVIAAELDVQVMLGCWNNVAVKS